MCLSRSRQQFQIIYPRTLTYEDVAQLSRLERTQTPPHFVILQWFDHGAVVLGYQSQVKRTLRRLGTLVRLYKSKDQHVVKPYYG